MGIITSAVVGGTVAGIATTTGGTAREKITNYKDKMTASLSRVQGYLGTVFEVAGNGSTFVGLNYNRVEPIRTAIREYVKAVQDVLSELNTEVSTTNALKGQIAVSAVEYVKAVSDVANAFVSALLAYSDKMFEHATQMVANDELLKKDVSDEAKALTNDVEVYKEVHQETFKAPSYGTPGADADGSAGIVSGVSGAAN